MKITPETTLAELQLAAAKDGITLITVKLEDGLVRAGLQFSERGETTFVVGNGGSIPEALDEAFGRLNERIAKSFQTARPQ